MLTKCKTEQCQNQKPRRAILCKACWGKLPNDLRMSIRDNQTKGNFTLRAIPDKDWISRVTKYVGHIKVPYVVGSGYSAVRLADDSKG